MKNMKVKVKDVRPNPYRNIENYPLSFEKVSALRKSIASTGFWDNLVARRVDVYNGYDSDGHLCGEFSQTQVDLNLKNGNKHSMTFEKCRSEIQIAYGHHRLDALRLEKGDDFVFEMPIKDLDDAMMIKIMANENMADWGTSPEITDETVAVTKEFLEQDSQFLESKNRVRGFNGKAAAIDISEFLGWRESKVQASLRRINLVASEVISEEAIDGMNEHQSSKFIEAIAKAKKDEVPLPKAIQKKIAKQVKSGNILTKDIKKVVDKEVNDFHFKDEMDEKKAAKKDERTRIKFDKFVNELSEETHDMIEKIQVLHDFLPEFKDANYKNIAYRTILMERLSLVQRNISALIEEFKGA